MHKKLKDEFPEWVPMTNKEVEKHFGHKMHYNVLGEMISDKAAERKATPIYSGVLAYFPDALAEVSKASLAGNKQHLDGQPLHWDRSKSKDQLDAATRHLIDHAKGEIMDDDGCYHLSKCAWRILAQLQLLIESKK